MGAFSETHLGAISEAHLGSSLGVHFSVCWPYWDHISGPSRTGAHLGAFMGGPFLRLYNGHSRGRLGGAYWGLFLRVFLSVFLGHF